MPLMQTLPCYLLAVLMVMMGVLHFVDPRGFAAIIPRALPRLLLVYVSGALEIALGLGLFLPSLRPLAAWGLIVLFVAVFPANVYQAIYKIPYGTWAAPPAVLWARLPLQAALIAWAYLYV